jgi:hypothetical protein
VVFLIVLVSLTNNNDDAVSASHCVIDRMFIRSKWSFGCAFKIYSVAGLALAKLASASKTSGPTQSATI